MAEPVETKFLKDIWPMILQSPVALFSIGMTFLMGYGISFLLFDYRTNPSGISHKFHIALGIGYSCLIFVVTKHELFFTREKPITLADIATYCPMVMIISFSILLIIMIVVTIIRERIKSGRRKNGQ